MTELSKREQIAPMLIRNPKIYLASKLKHADKAKKLMLDKPYITFTNRWQFFEAGIPDTKLHARNFWENDLDDVDAADCVLVYGEPEDDLRGALIEAGYGVGKGKLIVCVGEGKSFGTWRHSPRVDSYCGEDLALGADFAWKKLRHHYYRGRLEDVFRGQREKVLLRQDG